ncbi:SPFH domain-containing protein [Streptomyces sp. R35]|uniref:SPFH domain-containing protein n=1 Tax=Streptomyces sp. R35 TaxID=3238630 RepID=A0AB39SBP7_9ACTN
MKTRYGFLIAGGAVPLVLGTFIRRLPQANAVVVERFGRYTRTLNAGLNIVVPFADAIRNRIDLREQVVPFPPQEVLTGDGLVIKVDTVIYYQVIDARAATYEVTSYLRAIEQLTVISLRDICGCLDLERILSSREEISAALRGILDEATGKWGIRVNRIVVNEIDLPAAAREAMERGTHARNDGRVVRLGAEDEADKP